MVALGASGAFEKIYSHSQQVICVAHGINRIVNKALESNPSIYEQFMLCREITKAARKSDASDKLKKLNIPLPPGFNNIRWNSWFYQAEWVLSRYHAISSSLGSNKLNLEILRFVAIALKPLVDI